MCRRTARSIPGNTGECSGEPGPTSLTLVNRLIPGAQAFDCGNKNDWVHRLRGETGTPGQHPFAIFFCRIRVSAAAGSAAISAAWILTWRMVVPSSTGMPRSTSTSICCSRRNARPSRWRRTGHNDFRAVMEEDGSYHFAASGSSSTIGTTVPADGTGLPPAICA
jgi:hypothetical protein